LDIPQLDAPAIERRRLRRGLPRDLLIDLRQRLSRTRALLDDDAVPLEDAHIAVQHLADQFRRGDQVHALRRGQILRQPEIIERDTSAAGALGEGLERLRGLLVVDAELDRPAAGLLDRFRVIRVGGAGVRNRLL
jgi:hypothetical protein